MRVIAILFIWIFLGLALATTLHSFLDTKSKTTEAFCYESAEKSKIVYKDTQWAGLDFYQFCIDNIRYSSPLKRP